MKRTQTIVGEVVEAGRLRDGNNHFPGFVLLVEKRFKMRVFTSEATTKQAAEYLFREAAVTLCEGNVYSVAEPSTPIAGAA